MKQIFQLLSILIVAALPSCTDSAAKSAATEAVPENGAQFKKGEGLSLTDEMAKAIGLQTAEVTEEKITAQLPITLHILPGGNEANGWLTAAQTAKVQPGMKVFFQGTPAQQGTVVRIENAALAMLGDVEVNVSLTTPLAEGTEAKAMLDLPAGEATASVPKGALLTTAEGHFVYAKNGKFFVRTPVKVGATNETQVEITDGLYSGDEVVTTPVMSLWMAELQVLRGGKACTCGH